MIAQNTSRTKWKHTRINQKATNARLVLHSIQSFASLFIFLSVFHSTNPITSVFTRYSWNPPIRMNTSTSAQPANWECTFVRKHAKRKIKYPEGIFLQPELTLFTKKHYKTRQKQANQILRRGCWCGSHLSRTNSKCMHHVSIGLFLSLK